jgi:hypothetical protein
VLARSVLSFEHLACLRPAARLVFFWFWVLSFELACLRRANVS